jgi:nucleoid-associated protein YgaU
MLFTHFKAKDALIAIFLGLALTFLPAPSEAQEYVDDGSYSHESELMQAPPQVMPPRVVAAPLGSDGFRPPVEPPPGFGENAVPAATAGVRCQPVTRPAAPPPTVVSSVPAGAGGYQVQTGDSLALIAKKMLGTTKKWQELAAFNRITDPNSIYVGQVLQIPGPGFAQAAPGRAGYETAEPESSPVPRMVKTVPTAAPARTAPPSPPQPQSISADAEDADAGYYQQAGGTYVVQRGDTMAKIAKNLLGSTKKWRELAKANPHINPNKLVVGQALVVPGADIPSQGDMYVAAAAPIAAPIFPTAVIAQDQLAGPTSFDANTPGYSYAGVEPPPAAPPPMAYSGNAPLMSAPPAYAPPPGGAYLEPPPMPTTMPAPMHVVPDMPPPVAPVGSPIPPTSTTLYREERYRIPDELKPTDTTPYFANANGYHGLFGTECAMYPYLKTWHMGFAFRYDKYKYMNGAENVVDGRQWLTSLNLLYTGRRLMAGLTVPFQSWEVKPSGTTLSNVSMNSVYDPEVKIGYQIWKNYEGTHAVAMHATGRLTTDNYHIPFWMPGGASGRTTTGARVGPAGATRGSWAEFGGAYTGKLNERWTSHLNLGLAHDSDDNISKYHYRGQLDYRVNHHFSLVGELNGETYEMSNGPDGPNVDFLLGMAVFNDRWQGFMGFPIKLQSEWGYGHDFGFVMGLNARWD